MHEMRHEIGEKHSREEAGDVVIRVHQGFFLSIRRIERSWVRAPASEVLQLSSLSGLQPLQRLAGACLVAKAKETQRSIVPAAMLHGRIAWTCRSLGSWVTSQPPPKDSINCTLLVICCTRSVITVC